MAFQKKRIAVMLFFTAFWFYLFYVLGTVELSLTVAVLEIGMGIIGAAFIFTIFRCIITPLFFGRAFCSWICWSPGVFDLFGLYKGKTNLRKNNWLYLKYVVASLLILFGIRSLLTGNANNVELARQTVRWVFQQKVIFKMEIGFMIENAYSAENVLMFARNIF